MQLGVVVVAAGLSRDLELTRRIAMCSCGERKRYGTGGYQSCDGDCLKVDGGMRA